MSSGYLTDIIQSILAKNGESSADSIFDECQKVNTEIAHGAVCLILKVRDCFGRNPKTGLWGLRDG